MIPYGDEAGVNSPSLASGANGPGDDPHNFITLGPRSGAVLLLGQAAGGAR